MALPVADFSALRRLSSSLHQTEMALISWGRWKKHDEPPNAWNGVTTLARAIRQQVEGASQPGAPNIVLIDFLTDVDGVVATFKGLDSRIIEMRWVLYPDWPKSVICTRAGLPESTYDRRIRLIRDTVRDALGLDGSGNSPRRRCLNRRDSAPSDTAPPPVGRQLRSG